MMDSGLSTTATKPRPMTCELLAGLWDNDIVVVVLSFLMEEEGAAQLASDASKRREEGAFKQWFKAPGRISRSLPSQNQ